MVVEKALEVNNLTTSFLIDGRRVPAIKDVSFSLRKGEMLGLVGESGSGKSVTSLSILKLLSGSGQIEGGVVNFCDQNILNFSEPDFRKIRGNKISMIFQEPMTSLNPVYPVGDQISEVLRVHRNLSRSEIKERVLNVLDMVGIPSPQKRVNDYPHMLSGGMRQRVMIAMALVCEPEILIADEPTTALDVTIQAQILELISDLQERLSMSVLLITHDLGVVQERCDRVIMMYGGEIIEQLPTVSLRDHCKHPYTHGLLQSIPKLGESRNELYSIKGHVPKLGDFPSGCRFYGRCEVQSDRCFKETPQLTSVSDEHDVRCFNQLER